MLSYKYIYTSITFLFYFSKSEGSLSKLVNIFSKLYIFLNIKISDLKIIDIEDSKNSL